MQNFDDLKKKIANLEGKGYKAYQQLEGKYRIGDGVILLIDHVQGDPFATPSRVRLRIFMEKAGYPPHLYSTWVRKMALENYLLRNFAQSLLPFSRKRGSGKSGLYRIFCGDQVILKRSGCRVEEEYVEVRFLMGLPAKGRRILSKECIKMMEEIKRVSPTLFYSNLSPYQIQKFINLVEDIEWIRERLPQMGFISFVGENSILPRRSGVDQKPLENAIPFRSPPSLKVGFEHPNHGKVEGMGIPRGVILIVGGGFHGKTTLLNAIQEGIYPHIPGDGREWVITDPHAVKVRSEDGRYIEGVDISPFITHLPQRKNTKFFSTENASGSTSLAASIMEALEMGATALLMDEDTCATNFLIRDSRMQKLIAKEREPITPYVDRARMLWEKLGISSLLVVGGSGDYLEIADVVIGMKEFLPEDLTLEAKKVCACYPSKREDEAKEWSGEIKSRIVKKESFHSRKRAKNRVKTKGLKEIVFGNEVIDVSCVEQIVEETQLRCIGEIMRYYGQNLVDEKIPLKEGIEKILKRIKKFGFEFLTGHPSPDLALPRGFEVAQAFNRWRSLRVMVE